MNLTSELEVSLHINQLKIFNSNAKLKAVNAARGFGKSTLLQNDILVKTLGYQVPDNCPTTKVAALIMPTRVQCQAIHWIPFSRRLENHPLVRDINRADLRIQFHSNKPDLIFRGADRQGDRLRGLDLVYAGLDEYQDFDPTVFDAIIFPAIGRNKVWHVLSIGTPKGKTNHFYSFCKQAYTNPEYRYFHFKSEDNLFFPKENLERARLILPPRLYRQEHEASWEDLEGSIFPEFNSQNIVDDLPQPILATYLSIDWGEVNPAIVVIRLYQDYRFQVVDCWTNPRSDQNVPVPEAEVINQVVSLARKHQVYRVYAPDDRPASILSIHKRGEQEGLDGLRRAIAVQRNKIRPMEGFAILNSLFYQTRLFIHPRLKNTIQNFASLHRAKSNGFILEELAANQQDHDLDAIRYCVATLEMELLSNKAA